ncbi:MAG: hypothetical protein JXQ65_01125 [Candidatus Marinimicrobia bacterium]|nr:hypothetical protein [Candidatus Neomarinimicrobiota bacterium]
MLNAILNNKEIFIIISLISVITFLGSIILIPFLIINLSPDYFSGKKKSLYLYKHPLIRYIILILKNVMGFLLIIMGIVMLFIPGQGLLSIAIGLLFINFPGKKKLEYKFFTNAKIASVINHIRSRAGKNEIDFKIKRP